MTDRAAMTVDTPVDTPANMHEKGAAEKPVGREENFFLFLLKLVLFVLLFRSFVLSPFNIPSESMLPTLMNGDYLLAAKWSYGYSRYSLPGDAPLIPGRILADMPDRGDVVIFKHPVDGIDYVKRAIALPGDTVAMRGGALVLNGRTIERTRIADFDILLSPNTQCHPYAVSAINADGMRVCRYRRYRETLPGGASYDTLDLGEFGQDDFEPTRVPDGAIFVMGDNRDNSEDSRFDAVAGGGVDMVPQELLVGRAAIVMWSTDGSADWLLPWTWFTALRADRLGALL